MNDTWWQRLLNVFVFVGWFTFLLGILAGIVSAIVFFVQGQDVDALLSLFLLPIFGLVVFLAAKLIRWTINYIVIGDKSI